MSEKLHSPQLDDLFDVILNLRDRQECYQFFEDLCTIAELHDMGQRFQVARLLSKGMIYQDIVSATGASTTTISRVNRALQHGADGYRQALKRCP